MILLERLTMARQLVLIEPPSLCSKLDELGDCSGFLVCLDLCGPELAGEFSPAAQVILGNLSRVVWSSNRKCAWEVIWDSTFSYMVDS